MQQQLGKNYVHVEKKISIKFLNLKKVAVQ